MGVIGINLFIKSLPFENFYNIRMLNSLGDSFIFPSANKIISPGVTRLFTDKSKDESFESIAQDDEKILHVSGLYINVH